MVAALRKDRMGRARVEGAQPVVVFKEGSNQQRPSHQVACDVASSDGLPYRLKTRRGNGPSEGRWLESKWARIAL